MGLLNSKLKQWCAFHMSSYRMQICAYDKYANTAKSGALFLKKGNAGLEMSNFKRKPGSLKTFIAQCERSR